MGNLNEQEKKTNSLLYLESLENSFVNEQMLKEMFERWQELGKPLFMVPKEFKDRILQNMDTEVKINYLKWLTNGLEIDIFEIMTILILYSNCDNQVKMIRKFIYILFVND